MSFTKITPADLSGKGLLGRENPLVGSLAENQRAFDELTLDVTVPAFNRLTDELAASTAATSIGTADGNSVQAHIDDEENPHKVTKEQLGLSHLDDTADLDKPISTATQAALDDKVDKAVGMGLSHNDYTTSDKEKLQALPDAAALTLSLSQKVDKETGKGLSHNDYTTAEKEKLASLPQGAALSSELSQKVDKETGKGLSHNDYTDKEKAKLAAIPSDAVGEAQVLTRTNTTLYTPTADYHPATKAYVDAHAGGGGVSADEVLTKTNTTPYTPTADYHPATKAYADAIAASAGAVVSVFGRAGAVVAQPGDYTAADVGADPAGSAAAVSTALSAHTGNVELHTSTEEKAANTAHIADGDIHTSATEKAANAEHRADTAVHVSETDRTSWNGKARHSTVAEKTLLAAGWTGDTAPYSQTLAVEGVTATSANEVLPGVSITAEELSQLQLANLQDGGQQAGSITLQAYGEKPNADLPIRIIVRGDL